MSTKRKAQEASGHDVVYSPENPHAVDLPYDVNKLINAAVKAKDRAYCPYSNFRVGAAAITVSGDIFTGCNVENCSYGLTICAERVAIPKAVSEGHKHFLAIAIAGDVADRFIAPCGACRQVLAEFGNYDVLITKPDKTYQLRSVLEFLPLAFVPDDLEQEPVTKRGRPRPASPLGPVPGHHVRRRPSASAGQPAAPQ